MTFDNNGDSGDPCGTPGLRGLEVLADQHARTQILANQPQQRLIPNFARYTGHQSIVGHPVEEFRQVHVHGYPVPRLDIALYLLDAVVGGAPGPKAETRRGEVRVEERSQHLRNRLLDHPIDDGRNAQQPFPLSVSLWNLRAPDRGGLIGLVSYRLANARPVVARKRWELLNGHPIDTRSTVVGFHLVPGFA